MTNQGPDQPIRYSAVVKTSGHSISGIDFTPPLDNVGGIIIDVEAIIERVREAGNNTIELPLSAETITRANKGLYIHIP